MGVFDSLMGLIFWQRGLALRQVAALCYRRTDADLEFLLVTTRHRGIWIIPRGWPRHSVPDSHMAATEAMEEAGVEGDVSEQSIGHYLYEKMRKRGQSLPCRTVVYGLEVTIEHKKWKEHKQRQREWVSREEAAMRVSSPELKELILEFMPNDSKDSA